MTGHDRGGQVCNQPRAFFVSRYHFLATSANKSPVLNMHPLMSPRLDYSSIHFPNPPKEAKVNESTDCWKDHQSVPKLLYANKGDVEGISNCV